VIPEQNVERINEEPVTEESIRRAMEAVNRRASDLLYGNAAMDDPIRRLYSDAGHQRQFEDAQTLGERAEVARRAGTHVLRIQQRIQLNSCAHDAAAAGHQRGYCAAGYEREFEDALATTSVEFEAEIVRRAQDHFRSIREMNAVTRRAQFADWEMMLVSRPGTPHILSLYNDAGYRRQFDDAQSNHERWSVSSRADRHLGWIKILFRWIHEARETVLPHLRPCETELYLSSSNGGTFRVVFWRKKSSKCCALELQAKAQADPSRTRIT
jgi:hypothetical protein